MTWELLLEILLLATLGALAGVGNLLSGRKGLTRRNIIASLLSRSLMGVAGGLAVNMQTGFGPCPEVLVPAVIAAITAGWYGPEFLDVVLVALSSSIKRKE